MNLENINFYNRIKVNKFLKQYWFSTDMVVQGKVIDMTKLDGIIAIDNSNIVGLAMYDILNNECELISINSLHEHQGIGTTLLDKVIDIAKQNNCTKIKLITTNDNINAIKFYQQKGFDMVKLYCNAVDKARKLKPNIPLVGDNNIVLKHEIEFEKIL